MATATILKVHLKGHNLIAIAHILTKFGSDTKTYALQIEIPSNLTSTKIQDGGFDCHFENEKAGGLATRMHHSLCGSNKAVV